jgi:hypothetical protein
VLPRRNCDPGGNPATGIRIAARTSDACAYACAYTAYTVTYAYAATAYGVMPAAKPHVVCKLFGTDD